MASYHVSEYLRLCRTSPECLRTDLPIGIDGLCVVFDGSLAV